MEDDAFAVMMRAAKAAKFGSNHDCHNDSAKSIEENTFDRMMSSARKPAAFCTISDADIIGYFDRHPEWRLLIEELIEEEKDQQVQQQACKDHCADEIIGQVPEPNATIKRNLEELFDNTCDYDMDSCFEDIDWGDCPDHDSDQDSDSDSDHTFYNYETYSTLTNRSQVWQMDELRKKVTQDIEKITNKDLASPPTKAEANTAVTTIHVHLEPYFFDGLGRWSVSGFTLVYDSGVEIVKGRASFRNSTDHNYVIDLEPGEHVVGVKVLGHFDPEGEYNSRPARIKSIGFRTTNGRQMIAFRGIRDEWEDDNATTPLSEREKRTPTGTVLHSIDFDVEADPPTLCLIPVPLESMKHCGRNPREQRIPTLQTLVECKLEDEFKSKVRKSFQKLKKGYKACERDQRLYKLYHRNFFEHKLQKSTEATTVRSLERLVKFATNRVENKTSKFTIELRNLYQAYIQGYGSRRKNIEKDLYKKEQLAIYMDHLAFHEMNARLSAANSSEEDTNIGANERLCISPRCRRVYRPQNVPLSRRCGQDGCSTTFALCGCLVYRCPECHLPLCPWHAEAHRTGCRANAE